MRWIRTKRRHGPKLHGLFLSSHFPLLHLSTLLNGQLILYSNIMNTYLDNIYLDNQDECMQKVSCFHFASAKNSAAVCYAQSGAGGYKVVCPRLLLATWPPGSC